ncbi:hypothetical protein [Candidatus Berkiella aquae]|uniref:Uncharacterized protein n=1 Tax=Candidatus Berkiella aquae TaxID=295108 RepID=A0A0Q9YWA0_9GAMM|nr:hypothetical protein [Candidatus Berkiella aquae]MCS5710309.1 hypothetical protein [Candidatus Berkiella aquae]
MSQNGPQDFQIKHHVASPLKHKVMTSLPKDEKILALKTLKKDEPQLFADIMASLKQVYSYITDRQYVEDTPTFFHHNASAALYEEHCRTKIKNKSHGLKLGGIYCNLKKTLTKIQQALRQKKLCEQQDILRDFEAEFIWHINICIHVLPLLSEELKAHLAKHNALKVDELQAMPVSPQKRKRVSDMHPATPEKIKSLPFAERQTPKKMSSEDKKSEALIRKNGSPSKVRRTSPLFSSVASILNTHPCILEMKNKADAEDTPALNARVALTFQFDMQKEEEKLPKRLEPENIENKTSTLKV